MQNYWNLDLQCKQKQLTGPVNYRDFRETGHWPLNQYPRTDQCKRHSRLECTNYTLFQTKTVKTDALFQTKTAKKKHTLWRHTYLLNLYKGVTPPPSPSFQVPHSSLCQWNLDSGFLQLYSGFEFNNRNSNRNPLGGEVRIDIALFPINAVIDWVGLPFLVSRSSLILP